MKLLKLSLIAVTGLLFIASCQDKEPERQKDLLDPSLVHNPRTAGGIPLTEIAQMPTLDFDDSVHNFGTANEGEKLVHEFTFKNNGKTPLLISGATGSCGCTVPEYPHEPIAPGKTGVLKATFNTAGKPGHQEKAITVSSNTARGVQYLTIQADVTPQKD